MIQKKAAEDLTQGLVSIDWFTETLTPFSNTAAAKMENYWERVH